VTGRTTPTQDPERYEDEYDYYERMFDPVQTDRRARRRRKPVPRHVPKRDEDEVIAELGDLAGLEGGFRPTYTPGRYEEGWLLQSIRSFYDEGLIVDVLASTCARRTRRRGPGCWQPRSTVPAGSGT
jgi:hypothetical protein